MKKHQRTITLLIIVVTPLLVYLFLKTFWTHEYQKLQIVGEPIPVENQAGEIDTVYQTVWDRYPDFRFVSQLGDTLTWDSLRGKTFVADVFFTSCPTFCPKLSESMAQLHNRYFDDPNIRFLSITVDPDRDTVPALYEYAGRYGADPHRWYFITGEKQELFQLANKAFFFPATEREPGELHINHSDKLMLVDKEGRVRKGEKFYSGTESADVQLLIDEIKLLKLEYSQRENER